MVHCELPCFDAKIRVRTGPAADPEKGPHTQKVAFTHGVAQQQPSKMRLFEAAYLIELYYWLGVGASRMLRLFAYSVWRATCCGRVACHLCLVPAESIATP